MGGLSRCDCVICLTHGRAPACWCVQLFAIPAVCVGFGAIMRQLFSFAAVAQRRRRARGALWCFWSRPRCPPEVSRAEDNGQLSTISRLGMLATASRAEHQIAQQRESQIVVTKQEIGLRGLQQTQIVDGKLEMRAREPQQTKIVGANRGLKERRLQQTKIDVGEMYLASQGRQKTKIIVAIGITAGNAGARVQTTGIVDAQAHAAGNAGAYAQMQTKPRGPSDSLCLDGGG